MEAVADFADSRPEQTKPPLANKVADLLMARLVKLPMIHHVVTIGRYLFAVRLIPIR